MTKFTRRFNGACSRVCFWQELTAKLADFDSLIKRREHLTPDDVRALVKIHNALYECYTASNKQVVYHKTELTKLKEAYLHESRTINQ